MQMDYLQLKIMKLALACHRLSYLAVCRTGSLSVAVVCMALHGYRVFICTFFLVYFQVYVVLFDLDCTNQWLCNCTIFSKSGLGSSWDWVNPAIPGSVWILKIVIRYIFKILQNFESNFAQWQTSHQTNQRARGRNITSFLNVIFVVAFVFVSVYRDVNMC